MSLLYTDWGMPINKNTICFLCEEDKNTCKEKPDECLIQFKSDRDKKIEEMSIRGKMYKDIIEEINKLLKEYEVDPVKQIEFNAKAAKVMMEKMMDEFV